MEFIAPDWPVDEDDQESFDASTWRMAKENWLGTVRAAGTQEYYRRIVQGFLEGCGKPPGEATADDVRRWKERLEGEKYAASTVRTYLLSLKSFYRYACALGLRTDNPVQSELLPKAEAYASGRALSREEEGRLLGAIDRGSALGRRDYALVLFVLRTGRSAREALGLRWGDVEVDRQGARYWWERRGKRRCAGLDWEAWGAMWEHLKGSGRLEGMQAGQAIFAPLDDSGKRAESNYGEDWQGHGLQAGTLSRHLKTYARWAGLDEGAVSAKTLRNTAGLRRLEAGCGLKELQEALGYGSLDAARAARRALLQEGAQAGRAYHSQRRGRGGQEGNTNADVLSR